MRVPQKYIDELEEAMEQRKKFIEQQEASITEKDYEDCEKILLRIKRKIARSCPKPWVAKTMIGRAEELSRLGARTALRRLERDYKVLCSRKTSSRDLDK